MELTNQIKKVSFLATGSEIINGDLQESNCHSFAKMVHKNGGQIYQHLHASDNKNEIISAIKYLLGKSDALIITGGLGPTSDDNTRFAVANATKKKLYFNESIWQTIVQRLERFHLTIAESNRQQALFPLTSILYPNKNGTALGFHLKWKEKLIFVLPGPPKECVPLFETHIIPVLGKENFFHKKVTLKWTTLGLVESEMATRIDALSKPYKVETAYRWHYPYLEIKLILDDIKSSEELVHKINLLLEPNIVSQEHKMAFEMLKEALQSIPHTIHIFDNLTSNQFMSDIRHQKLKFISKKNTLKSKKILFILESSQNLNKKEHAEYKGTITFKCKGFFKKNEYFHQLSVPYRSEIIDYAKHYAAWQLYKFIKFCSTKTS